MDTTERVDPLGRSSRHPRRRRPRSRRHQVAVGAALALAVVLGSLVPVPPAQASVISVDGTVTGYAGCNSSSHRMDMGGTFRVADTFPGGAWLSSRYAYWQVDGSTGQRIGDYYYTRSTLSWGRPGTVRLPDTELGRPGDRLAEFRLADRDHQRPVGPAECRRAGGGSPWMDLGRMEHVRYGGVVSEQQSLRLPLEQQHVHRVGDLVLTQALVPEEETTTETSRGDCGGTPYAPRPGANLGRGVRAADSRRGHGDRRWHHQYEVAAAPGRRRVAGAPLGRPAGLGCDRPRARTSGGTWRAGCWPAPRFLCRGSLPATWTGRALAGRPT